MQVAINTDDLERVDVPLRIVPPPMDHTPPRSPFYRGQFLTSSNVNPDAIRNFTTPGIPTYRIVPPQPLALAGSSTNAPPAPAVAPVLVTPLPTPPPPTISQSLTSTAAGFQFTFLQVQPQPNALPSAAIAGYKVYRSNVNDPNTATVIQTIAHNPAGGPVVVQDAQPVGAVMFYWVSTVNVSGRESTLTPAQSGAVTSGSQLTAGGKLANADQIAADGNVYGRLTINALTTNNIDLSKTGFVNKNLDNVADGATYARPFSTRINAGRPWIDFSEAIHSNKNLGNVADDTGSGRFARRSLRVVAASTATWFKLGTWVFASDGQGHTMHIDLLGGNGFNTGSNQQTHAEIVVRSSNNASGAPNISGATWSATGNSSGVQNVKIVATGGNTSQTNNSWEVWALIGTFGDFAIHVDLDSTDTWTNSGVSGSDPGVASSTVVVATGGMVLDTSAAIYPAVGINGKALTVGTVHDRVNNTIDSGNVVVAGGVDFVRAYTNKNLDNVADGATYASIPVANIAGSGTAKRALIDFTQSHANKNIDNVADGTSFARVTTNALTTNNIDLSKTGFVNKNLDNVVDGTNFVRIPSGAAPANALGAGPMGGTAAATTTDTTINYGNAVAGSAALPGGVNGTNIYARWTGFLVPTVSGTYTIGVNSDDGANLFVNGKALVLNLPTGQPANNSLAYTQSGTITLTANSFYPLVLEWQQGAGLFEIQLAWTPPGGSIQLIPSGNLSTSSSSVTGNLAGKWWNGTASVWFPTGTHYIDFSATHVNKNLDNVPDGTRAAWDSGTQKTNAVDSSGNLILKNKTNASGSTSFPSTTSSIASVIPEMTTTITTKGNKVLACFNGAFLVSGNTTTTTASIAIFADGVQISNFNSMGVNTTTSNLAFPLCVTWIDSPSAGSHTYDARWLINNGGTLQSVGANRSLQVVELG